MAPRNSLYTQRTRTNGIRRSRYRGMADSASYAAFVVWTTGGYPKTHRWARAITSTLWSPNFEEKEPRLQDEKK